MARRSRKTQSSSSKLPQLIIGSLCALGLIAGGYFIITRPKSITSNVLDSKTYHDSPESIRGSTFSVKAEVVKKLHYEEGVTQAIVVKYNDENIPIEIPAKVKGPNINTQQEYTFIVKAKNDFWLEASSYTDK
jgi:uncharacterized protein YabE (DUF348 family)